MGCLILQERKGKSQNWLMQWNGADGKRCYMSSGTSNKLQARKKLEAIEAKIRDGAQITRDTTKRTFEDGVKLFEQDQKLANRSGADTQLGRVRKHLAPVFGGRKLRTITTDDIRDYFTARKATGAADASIVAEVRALRRMFRLANVTYPGFTCPKLNNARQGFFEPNQFNRVRASFAPDEWYWRAMLTVGYFTGWRMASEIATLQWSDVDLVHNTLTLQTSKNGEGREFPLDLIPELRAALVDARQYRKRQVLDDGKVVDLVFHRDGEALTVKPCGSQRTGSLKPFVLDAWRAACTAADVDARIPHDLRRTAVRTLTDAGVDPKTAMQFTGHKTMAVFLRYRIVNKSDIRRAAAKMAEYDAATRGKLDATRHEAA